MSGPQPGRPHRYQRIARWVLAHRGAALLVLLAMTAALAWKIPSIEVYSRFADLLPQQHPYIQNYNEMKEVFGGANVVTMSLEAVEGDIFTRPTLQKVRMVTREVDKIPGVNHYQVASIAHRKIRRVSTTASGMIRSESVLPREIPSDPAALKRLREEMFNNGVVYGTYVSEDGKAALIRAGFDEDRLDYSQIFEELQALKARVEADGTAELYISGEPMLKGWVYHHSGQLAVIFGVTAIIIVLLLVLHFRSLEGVLLPLASTGVSALWGLGLVGWLGYNLDPLILVVPLLISARTASHCVQFLERYRDELRAGARREDAVHTTMGELLRPAVIAIFTDAAGLLVLAVASIPLIRKLGIFCSFWSLSNVVSVALLVPILLSILPAPKVTPLESGYEPSHIFSRIMARLGRFLVSPRAALPVLAVAALTVGVSIYYGTHLVVGENRPGSPILFEDSEFNVAARKINERFAGANQLNVYFESDEAHAMKRPDVARTMEELRERMMSVPGAGGTRDIPGLVRSVNRLYHYDDPRWWTVPPTAAGIGNMLFMYEAGAPIPGVILEYMDLKGKRANFVTFFKDAQGSTVERALAAAKGFIEDHPLEGVRYRLAGGIVGVRAAANEEIARSELAQTFLIMAVVTLSVLLTYRSVTAAGLVFLVLGMAVLINRAYMGARGIGLNINTLPVTAVGIGIGVDYAIYVLDRIREVRGPTLADRVVTTLRTTGSAVVFTAVTVVGGIVYWIVGSDLRFNAEMAVLLTLLMLSNMFGAVTLLPLLVARLRPRFCREGGGAPSEAGGSPAPRGTGRTAAPRTIGAVAREEGREERRGFAPKEGVHADPTNP